MNMYTLHCIPFLKFAAFSQTLCEIFRTTIGNYNVNLRSQTDMPAGDQILHIRAVTSVLIKEN